MPVAPTPVANVLGETCTFTDFLHGHSHTQGKQCVTTVSVLATNNVCIRYGHGLTAGSVSGTKRTPCTYVMGHFIRTYNTAPVETPVQARLVPWRSPFCNNTKPPTLHADTVSLYCRRPRFLTCPQPHNSTLNGVMWATYSRSCCACIEYKQKLMTILIQYIDAKSDPLCPPQMMSGQPTLEHLREATYRA